MAIKTAVAPTVLVCVIEVDAYINYFTTNAYLAAIMAASALPALPQAKLIEYNLQLALATVVTYCWALLAGWSAVQARKHTTNSSEDLAGYNSSAEAVVAIFMIFILWSTKISGEGEEDRSSSVRQLEESQQWFISTIVKARQDVIYADCEVSWDHIGGSDLEYIASLLVDLIPPASGLSSTANMMQLATEGCNSRNGTNTTNGRDEGNDTTNNKRDWHYLEVTMHEHSLRISKAIMDGAEHGKVRLDQILGCSLFGRPRARETDEEHRVGSMRPGTASFLSSYRGVCSVPDQQGHCVREEELLHNYMRNRPQVEYWDLTAPEPYSITLRYFLLLHFQTLLSSLGGELLQLLVCLEECHMKPKRLRFPRFGRLARFIPWPEAMVRPWRCWQEGADVEADAIPGLAFDKKRDPDHLPPVNLVQSVGDRIRRISSVLHTDHAAYGLRGVCAIMTIAIISFLHDSQTFYFGHQFLWAMFAILLSMGRTAGSSTFFLLCRILGTFISMIACYLIWYIPDQTTPGILVLLWIWFTAIGYLSTELQYRKLGQEAISKAGLVVYAPYIIFPYRLAVVTVGVLTGYFWTIIPYPLPEHYELRQNAAQSMYMLAKFYMCVRQTIFARIHGTAGNLSDKTSAGFCLQGARRRAFREYQTLVGSGKKSFQFLDWEFSLGGSFPKHIYGEILSIIERLGGYMTLTEYASRSLNRSSGPSPWWNADQTGVVQSYVALDGIATRLIILHSALIGSHALPPQLKVFEIPGLRDFLSKGIPSEEGFASAALIRSINWNVGIFKSRLM
ncbi:hypothetical protein N8T08_008962 [Aspergillus melleus]|uniref:Uncharacterized protein n=1 Tax=Aspergillus melleus TaxID=138277 RepID=A0ACC3AUQ1_9EURO|nr:hypothetical protein N8T08_008962 [Aspergillus melleus]